MEEASLRRAMAQEQELEEGRRALKTQVCETHTHTHTHYERIRQNLATTHSPGVCILSWRTGAAGVPCHHILAFPAFMDCSCVCVSVCVCVRACCVPVQTFWNVGSRAGDRFAPSGLREPSAASTPVVAPYAQDTETPIMSAPVSRGSYSGNYAAAGVPAAGYTAPTAAAGRLFPGANSSSLMEHVLQQRDLDTHPAYATAAPAEFAAPTAADYDMYDFPPTDAPRPQYIAAPLAPLPPMAPVSAGRLVTPYATGYGADQTVGRASVPRASSIPASAYVAGGADGNAVMRAAGLGGVGGAERLGSRSSAVPYATADNNEAYRAAPPPPRAGRGDAGGVAPFATADSSAPYAPARAASAGSAPFATDDAIAAAAGGAPIGLRYAAARSAVAGRRAGVPWATDDDGDGAAGAGVIYPATAAVSRRGTGQAPPVVTSMSQILGGASAAPLIANGRRQNSFTRM